MVNVRAHNRKVEERKVVAIQTNNARTMERPERHKEMSKKEFMKLVKDYKKNPNRDLVNYSWDLGYIEIEVY